MSRLGYGMLFWLAGTMASSVLAAPPNLYNLDRKVRFLSLAEARAIALEHGSVGQPSLLFSGIGLDNVTTPQAESNSPKVRVGSKPGSKRLILTGIPRDPRPAERERNINQMLLNVENAYWNLYGSYWQLHSREQGLRLAYETWKMAQGKYKVGKVSSAAVAQAEGQYNLFRSQRLQALDTVLDNERQLRAMLGMTIDDGERLVPSDSPTVEEKKPDWKAGWHRALIKRPELHMARKDVEDAKLNLVAVKTMVLPLHRIFGLESCEKREPAEQLSIRRCALQECDPKMTSCMREAQLHLARAQLVLQDQELKAERFLGLYYRRMSSAYFQIKAARAQREAFATQLKIREAMFRDDTNEPGASTTGTLNLLLESQRFWAEALATEFQAIVTYNNSLCGWEFAKGDIMKHAHVRIGDEPSCGGTMERATVREKKRTRARVRHAPQMPESSPLDAPTLCNNGKEVTAPSLPMLWKTFPHAQDFVSP
jgi:hypothetical protein